MSDHVQAARTLRRFGRESDVERADAWDNTSSILSSVILGLGVAGLLVFASRSHAVEFVVLAGVVLAAGIYATCTPVWLVAIEVDASTVRVIGHRWERTIRVEDLAVRRGSGYMTPSTPASSWAREWRGPPSSSSRGILLVSGWRKFDVLCDSTEEAEELESALRRSKNSKTTTYQG